MNKTELIGMVANKADITKKEAEVAVNAILEAITEGLVAEGKVALLGFGTFEVSERAARKGRNPATGEEIEIPASKYPTFSASKALKDSVNG